MYLKKKKQGGDNIRVDTNNDRNGVGSVAQLQQMEGQQQRRQEGSTSEALKT